MKIGYISRRTNESGKETFKFIEANGTRRIGTRTDTIKVKFLYGTTPTEEIQSNTEIIRENNGIILVREPFFTDDELSERMQRWCEWANTCEHREYSFFGEVNDD